MTPDDLELRLERFRARKDEYPHALASALLDAGRAADALEVIQLVIETHASDPTLLTLQGRAFYEHGELHEAQRSLLRAAKANPHDKEPYRWLAQVLIERGDAVRAVQVLERAIAIDPIDVGLRKAHARAQRLLNSPRNRMRSSGPPSQSMGLDTGPQPRASSFPPGAKDARTTTSSLPPSANPSGQPARPSAASTGPVARAGGAAGASTRPSGAPAAPSARSNTGPNPAPLAGPLNGPSAQSPRASRPPVAPAARATPGSLAPSARTNAPAAPSPRGTLPGLRPSAPGVNDTRPNPTFPPPTSARSLPGLRPPQDTPRDARPPQDTSRDGRPAHDTSRDSRPAHDALRDGRRPQDTPRDPRPGPSHARDLRATLPSGSSSSPSMRPDDARSALAARLSGRSSATRSGATSALGSQPPRSGNANPFDTDLEQDDSPTMAMDMPEALRSGSLPEQRPAESVPPPDDDDEFDESAQTSIVPAARELELLQRGLGLGHHPLYEPGSDATIEVVPLASPGEPEPPEQVLQVLKTQGVFESQGRTKKSESWVKKTEVLPSGIPVRRALVVSWALAVVAAAGGYYGFQTWLGKRRADATAAAESALEQAYDGQHESLVEAEKRAIAAHELDPKSHDILRLLLFVQTARALDEGDSRQASVRETLARADQASLTTPIVDVVKGLFAPVDKRDETLDGTLERAQNEASADAETSYLAGKLALASGRLDAAKELVTHATTSEPRLSLAWIALGEQARAEGQLEQAHTAFERALGPDQQSLRAELWLALLDARPSESTALLERLRLLEPRIALGSDADKLLAQSARAFAELAAGQVDKARLSVRAAESLEVQDPELLAFFAEQALRAGEGALAFRAARAASEAGGGAHRYQSLVAAALLQQGDGERALSALASLGEGHGALALARANAALLTDARDALQLAKRELAAYRATPQGKDDVEASSLLMRVDLHLGAAAEALLPAARALAQRAPEALAAHLALGEAQVAAGQGSAAIETLTPALRRAPGSADAHYLLGRAQLLAGRPDEARKSLERAVTLAPSHLEARRALGRLLLDGGDYDAALSLFRALESAGGGATTLGIIEALLGKGVTDEAARKLEALAEPTKGSPKAAILRAKLSLQRGKPIASIDILSPLVGEEADTRDADTLALIGDAQLAAERVNDALSSYGAALELEPTHPDALLGRAQIALRNGRADEALELAQRGEAALAQHARPPKVRALLLVAAARAELSKQLNASAISYLERAVALPGTAAESHYWYGEALARTKSGDPGAQYKRYLELEPNGIYATRAQRALSSTR